MLGVSLVFLLFNNEQCIVCMAWCKPNDDTVVVNTQERGSINGALKSPHREYDLYEVGADVEFESRRPSSGHEDKGAAETM